MINKMLFLMEIEFIDVRNVAKGFILEKYSETMVALKGGDCRPTKRRGIKLRQQRDESIKCEPIDAFFDVRLIPEHEKEFDELIRKKQAVLKVAD